MADFLEIRHIITVMIIHNQLTQQVLLLTGENMAEFPKNRQFNPVITFRSKVVSELANKKLECGIHMIPSCTWTVAGRGMQTTTILSIKSGLRTIYVVRTMSVLMHRHIFLQ